MSYRILEKKIICDHLHYNPAKGMYKIDLVHAAKLLYRRELLGFFPRIFKSWNREKCAKQESYIDRIKNAFFRLLDEWNFARISNKQNNKLQDVTLKIKVFFQETPEFRREVKSMGVAKSYYHLIQGSKNKNVLNRDNTKGQLLFIEAKRRRKKHWEKLSKDDQFLWHTLAEVMNAAEKSNINRYYKLAKDFYSFDALKKDLPKDEVLHSKDWNEHHIPEAVCIGMQLEQSVRNEVKIAEEFSSIFESEPVNDANKSSYEFVKNNSLDKEYFSKTKMILKKPLVWNVYDEETDNKNLLHVKVDRNINKAVITRNIRHYHILLDATNRIMEEEKGTDKQMIKFLESKKLIEAGRLNICHKLLLSGEKIVNLPLNYSDVLRVQVQAFLLP